MVNAPLVTVVIATYNRPTVLKQCLRSVLYQTMEDWIVYVIGDNCDKRTASVISEINHPRILYYNNPTRFGEQSGGNNIGMALAQSKYIALLNHDDIWTPDHLEKALKTFKNKEIDFYISSPVFSKRVDKNGFPILKNRLSNERKPRWAFSRSHLITEPCSTWIVTKEAFNKIGFWKHRSELCRFPIVEYVIRAWRKGLVIHFSGNITCVGCSFHHLANTKFQYDYVGDEHEQLVNYFQSKKSTGTYFPNPEGLKINNCSPNYFKNKKFQKKHIVANIFTAYFYYCTGIDVYEMFSFQFNKKQKASPYELSNRTGERQITKKPSLTHAINQAKKHLYEKHSAMAK